MLLDSPYEPVSLLVAERLVDDPLVTAFPGEVFVRSQEQINETVGFNMHRGMVACALRGAPHNPSNLTASATRLLVTECVSDPENLGALFRNAAAFGVDAVLLDPTTCDPLSRRVIRVSMGHALRVPFARAPLPELFAAMSGITAVALSPSAACDIRDVHADRVALLVGNEGTGLSDAAMDAADVRAAIAMAKGVDSLNLGTAAAVALALLGN